MMVTPTDYKNPDWKNASQVHDWKNYISQEVREIWAGFADHQKQALARQASAMADREEWD